MQASSQRPQATQFSLLTLATYALRDRFGVLNSWLVRSALQTLTLQLQIPKIFWISLLMTMKMFGCLLYMRNRDTDGLLHAIQTMKKHGTIILLIWFSV